MYSLTPTEELNRARAEFDDYEVFELHETSGIPKVVAVVKDACQRPGLSPLVCAATVEELCARLRAQETPERVPLPKRDRTRAYWEPNLPDEHPPGS
ncbi:hypothetical protein [Nocardiopsis ansamitocini]|uniref:Uncharacterized protein n=1 Tax=Nocardiopsis ansamitocini TaxID=1670832 RepID=A0A9W6ULC8_9ACTN|nr:hypothetical protein [Nocardiopsis ansamitocini]GLU49955.1 hypothetical protein Nans01_43060 [Nocardiopsis ansamitocini]